MAGRAFPYGVDAVIALPVDVGQVKAAALRVQSQGTVGAIADTGRVLDWSGLDSRKIERVAQLLVREFCGAISVDGSGGDLAQDLRLDDSQGWRSSRSSPSPSG